MRKLIVALPALFALCWTLSAQPPAVQPPPAQPPAAPMDPLDQVLFNWERAMTGVASLEAQCTRKTVQKTYNTTEVFEGVARFLKSDQPKLSSRASLEMKKQGRPDVFEKYVCTGNFLYEYAPQDKVIRVHPLPEPKNGNFANDNFLSFLFGMKAADAKARYKMVYVPPPPTDKWYYYLRIIPVQQADQADFSEARLTLSATTFLPRQVWFQQPNGNEVTWDFPRITTPANLRPVDFEAPRPPAGWQIQQMNQTQARVIRQSQ